MGQAADDRRDCRRGLGQPRLWGPEGRLIRQARELFHAPSQPLLRARDIMMQDEPVLDLAHLGHLELLTPKPEESLRFFVDVLGMTESGRKGDSVYLRAWDDYEGYSLQLTGSNTSGLGRPAFRPRVPLPRSGRPPHRALLRDGVVRGPRGPASGAEEPGAALPGARGRGAPARPPQLPRGGREGESR